MRPSAWRRRRLSTPDEGRESVANRMAAKSASSGWISSPSEIRPATKSAALQPSIGPMPALADSTDPFACGNRLISTSFMVPIMATMAAAAKADASRRMRGSASAGS